MSKKRMRSQGPAGSPAPNPAAGLQPVAPPYPEGVRELAEGVYDVRFARTAEDLERVQRLRYEVFNVELDEGLAESVETGRDADRFDATCHHLMLIQRASGALVGTYRLQTRAMAQAGPGYYCDGEFVLDALPADVLASAVELGRACILRAHRNGTALFGLWRGLASYLVWSRSRYFFGCCSLTSQEPREGVAMQHWLRRKGHMHATYVVPPRPEHACSVGPTRRLPKVELPALFGTYLRYGAKACGPPAIDRDFGTIDFLVLFDLEDVHPRLRRLFFAGLEGAAER